MCGHVFDPAPNRSGAGGVLGGLPANLPLPAAVKAAAGSRGSERRASSARLRLWDVAHKYHCPIIGTCLGVNELRALARKAGGAPRGQLSDYEVHVSFVAAAEDRNPLSQAVQKRLDRRHASTLKRFARAGSSTELVQLWKQALAGGQVQGALWAVMTHPEADAEVRRQAYEDVHMLSHQIGAGLSADLQALAETRASLTRLRRAATAEAERTARGLRERDARIADLEQRLQGQVRVERSLREARVRIRMLEQGDLLAELNTRVAGLERALAEQTRAAVDARREADALRTRCARAEAEAERRAQALEERTAACRALEQLLIGSEPEQPAACCERDCADCPHTAKDQQPVDLGGRRILCVGGRGSLSSHYRDLVERCNGRLIRHDGGLEDSRQRLESLLARADAVVCPAEYVSHDAYLRAKRFCKRTGTPCLLLERSGVGAFAQALADLAARQRRDPGRHQDPVTQVAAR